MSEERFLEQCEAHLAAEAERRISNISSMVPPGHRLTSHCTVAECGEELPTRRADAGYTICVDCAELREMRNPH
jgi:hypothetical protein